LKRHFARYTPEMVQDVCGVSPEAFEKVARSICDNSGPERTTAFVYSVGWTQHSIGVQYIRTAAIIQLLLGNMGRPGGGIMALRGHASIQGSTDIPTLYDLLPGYLPVPEQPTDKTLDAWVKHYNAAGGVWNYKAFMVSLLKAWFGPHATKDNDWGYEWLPMRTGDHSHMTTVAQMADGKVRGYFIMGENPTVGSMHGALHRKGLRELDWLVVRDLAPLETAEFWRTAPEIERGEIKTEDIKTEVFLFPAAAHVEKDGTFTNTQRLLQWHHKAVEPPGDCRSELHFVYHLGRRLQELIPELQRLQWDYPVEGPHQEPSADAVLQEINGPGLSSYSELKDDGSTACGCWIYCGCYVNGVNLTARRKPGQEQSWVALEWGWAWPANRRMLYNRASADPQGKPWSERKKYVWWDGGKWTGYDNPDFVSKPPDYVPSAKAKGIDTIAGDAPFILQSDGRALLFAPAGLKDGPLPTHYEPEESVLQNPLYGQQSNPMRMEWKRRDNPYHRAPRDDRYPYVITTFRLTEHHTAGTMSRWLTWLAELQPELFCEVSPALARERNLVHGGWATVITERAEVECRVLVTGRIPSLQIRGRTVHQIGLPYHWGAIGRVQGDAVNELISFVADPNVSIQESKALTGNIRPGRRSRR
ncbi:MAG: molybdopterin dinucleotide binding domain-containing protein, partial [Candidatus Xenobia bacterium]